MDDRNADPPADPLAGLDDVGWAGLDHAYGPAEDVPRLLRALRSRDDDERREAMYELCGSILHQGSRYEATVPAVPFLLALAADPAVPARDEIVRLLASIAIGDESRHLPSGVAVAAWRAEVARLRAADPADEIRRMDGWVAEAASGADRRVRELQRSVYDPARTLRSADAELACYDAVRAGVPVFRELLGDGDPEVRASAAYALAWFPEDVDAALPSLLALLDAEPLSGVAAHAIVSAGLLTADASAGLRSGWPPPGIATYAIVSDGLLTADAPGLPRQDAAVHRPGDPGGSGPGGVVVARSRELLGGADRLLAWAASAALAAHGILETAVIDVLAATVSDPPQATAPGLLFLRGDPREYALKILKGLPSPPPRAVDAILDVLEENPGLADTSLITTVLRATLGPPAGGPPPPYDELTVPQRRAVRAVASVQETSWTFGEIQQIALNWGLPGEREECRAYAGLTRR
ncbi:HEAT repeat domain-containing protein [Spirillospora sp. CA-255316]